MSNGHFAIVKLLEQMKPLAASDLHIKVGIPPTYRINGPLRPVAGDPITEAEADHMLDDILKGFGTEAAMVSRPSVSLMLPDIVLLWKIADEAALDRTADAVANALQVDRSTSSVTVSWWRAVKRPTTCG